MSLLLLRMFGLNRDSSNNKGFALRTREICSRFFSETYEEREREGDSNKLHSEGLSLSFGSKKHVVYKST